MQKESDSKDKKALAENAMIFNSYESERIPQYYCVDNAGYQSCSSGYYIKRRDYDTYLLLLTTSGQGKLQYHGKKYELNSGSLLFINCNDPHTYHTVSSEPWQMTWIHFIGNATAAFYKQIYTNSGPVIALSSYVAQFVNETILSIIRSKQNCDYLFDYESSDLLSSLMHKLIMHIVAPTADKGQLYVAEAIDYIRANYKKDISLSDIADAVHLSKYYFSTQFKTITGFSPYDYLVRHRIAKSKSLLATSDDTISAIAAKVGFNSTSNYISTFKQYENTTPLKYRKNKMTK